MRWPARLARLLGGLLLLAPGCALDDGRPWAEVTVELTAAFEPAPERLTAEGWLQTPDDFAIRLDAVAVGFDAVVVLMADEEAEAAEPALCHGDHCHGADAPEDHAEDAPAAGVVQAMDDAPVTLGSEPSVVPLGACSDDCGLGLGELGSVEVEVHALELRGRIFDLSGLGRLPDEGVALDLKLPLEAVLRRDVEGDVGPGAPHHVGVIARFTLPDDAFDHLDLGAPPDEAVWAEELSEHLAADPDALTVEVLR